MSAKDVRAAKAASNPGRVKPAASSECPDTPNATEDTGSQLLIIPDRDENHPDRVRHKAPPQPSRRLFRVRNLIRR